MKASVLLLEDDERLAKSLARDFEDHGYSVQMAPSISKAPWDQVFDFAVVDLRLSSGEFGLNAIEKIKAASPSCRILILSGYGSITTAVEAVKRGAVDYLTKPASFREIEAALSGQKPAPGPDFKVQSLAQVEHEHIDYLMIQNEGNITKTAKDLGLHRQSLQRKLKKYI